MTVCELRGPQTSVATVVCDSGGQTRWRCGKKSRTAASAGRDVTCPAVIYMWVSLSRPSLISLMVSVDVKHRV